MLHNVFSYKHYLPPGSQRRHNTNKKRESLTTSSLPLYEDLELPYYVEWTVQMPHAEKGMHSLADTLTRSPQAIQPTST